MSQLKINSTNPRWYSLEDLPNEVWKDIKGYEGLYRVSNYGRVKSLKRNTACERILKPRLDKGGYLYINLSKNGICKSKKVHRLVGDCFILNLKHKPQINHIDGNKTNNYVNNLEWSTAAENARHAVDTGLWVWDDAKKDRLSISMRKIGVNNLNSDIQSTHTRGHICGCVPINQYTVDGEFVKQWFSMSDVKRELNIHVPNLVRACKTGGTSHGYKWLYCDLRGGDDRGE